MKRPGIPLLLFEFVGVLAFIALAAVRVIEPAPGTRMAPLDPEALAAATGTERWNGIFFQNQHVGYAVSRVTPVVLPASGGTRHGTLFEERADFRIATMGKLQHVVTAGAALTDDDGRLQRFDFFLASAGSGGGGPRLSLRGRVEPAAHGDTIVIEVQQAGETKELRIPVDAPPQLGMTLEAELARLPLAQGYRFSLPYFDPLTMAEGTMDFEVTDSTVLPDGNEAWWIRGTFGDITTRMLVSSSGEVLRQEGALGMALQRMSEQAARDLPSTEHPVDLISLSAVRLKGRIADARGTHTIELKIEGVPATRVMNEPPLQTVQGDHVRVDVPLLAELPLLPVSDFSNPEWVAATVTLPATHPELRQKAMEIVGDAPDRLTAVERLVHWVYHYVEKVPTFGVPNGLEVLHSARGDCNEHTALFVSLARAAGIPARIAAGVVYSARTRDQPAFYYHAWPEVRLGGPTEWVPVDPTLDQVPADATHVKLAQGDLAHQVEIMSVMGKLGFELIEAE